MKPYSLTAALLACVLLVSFLALKRSQSPEGNPQRPEPVGIADASPVPEQRKRASNGAVQASVASFSSPAPLRRTVAVPEPAVEPEFAAFNEWWQRYDSAPQAERPALEVEGRTLAQQRRAAMFSLIQTDPDRALALAAPRHMRRQMPDSIRALMEEPINARGDYEVLATIPLPGNATEITPIQRHVSLPDGRRFRAFPAAFRRDYPTRFNSPLAGVAQDDVMAVGNPVELLSGAEASALPGASAADPICSVSGDNALAAGESTPALIGGDLHWMCQYGHAEWMNGKLLAAAGQPGGSSIEGGTAESNYTEGRKRIILFRVAFPNVTTPALTALAGNQMLTNMNTYWHTISYGRTTVAMPGEGSDVVLVNLTQHTTNYNDDASKLRADVRAAATALGVDLSRYDFDVTCVGGSPSFPFAGLAYVGAPGAWLANSYFGTATAGHELGHNLGAPHANYWDTGGASAIGSGANEEYGDPYDIMGGGGTPQGHYVAKFKWRIGWLADTNFPRVTSNGRYRVYAQDHFDATGVRGLRFGRNGSMDYFAEFRQLYTGNNWMMNGLRLCWGGNGSSWSSQMIDTTPGSANGKTDSPILIGQTFSDPAAGVHVTPIGKGNTHPESLDVVVNFATPASNRPPVVALSASSTNVAAGGVISFAVSATDPNGDTLAYYWDFDDGGYSVNNDASQVHSFAGAGDYSVRCVVSDMKGGRTTRSIVVRVGNPTTFSISGRVLDNNKPVEGVLIRAGSRMTHSASDGTYTLTRLATGSHSVTAALDPFEFIRPWSPSSIAVGPSASHVDFINLPGGLPQISLVSTGSVWRYLDNGSDQGTAWRAPAFDDTAWASGPGQLGYGDSDEARVVSYGVDANNKHVTTYFRRAFQVSDPASVTNLVLQLHRDDGGVVYLNGVEVFRNNLPAGPIGYRTLAVSGVEGATVQTNLPQSLLVQGTNVFAVEIHQVQLDSSDLSFDLSLRGNSTTVSQSYSALYVASPGEGAALPAGSNVTITAHAFNTGGTFTTLEFYVDGVKLGEDAAAPYSTVWTNAAAGLHTLTVRGALAAGGFSTSAPVNVIVAVPVAPPALAALIPAGAAWKFKDDGSNQGTAWKELHFDDSTWAGGTAELGYGDGDEITTVGFGANSAAKHITTYFRRSFVLDEPSTVTNLALGVLRDDGAIVYLNGVEIFRDNMPAGIVGFTTPAVDAIEDENTFFSGFVDPSLLVAGTNVLAVEIHQESGTSSDISFNLHLTAQLAAQRPPGVYLTSPSTQTLAAPADITFAALAVPAAGQSIERVAFYAHDNLLGEDASPPYGLVWSNAPLGVHQLTARAVGSGGNSVTSSPVTLTLHPPAYGTQLISRRSQWRYLDDGSDPGTAWTSRTFNDSEWSLGYARLGYGGDGEYTVVSYGSDAGKRHPATYFRKSFLLGSTAGISNLTLLLSRDDAAAVYLNGVEVHRSNLLSGPISFNSLAAATVNAPEETNFYPVNISRAALVAGTNVIAVEVHQASINSSDLGFDLELIAQTATNFSSGAYITAPANGARITLPAPVEIAAFGQGAGLGEGPIIRFEFFSNGAKVGEDTTAPYSLAWNNPPLGSHSLVARAVFAGGFQDSAPVNITVDGPPAQITPVFETSIAMETAWRYWSNGVVPAADWTALTFDDAAWPIGQARFGWGLDGETTSLPSGRTHYFRRTFNVVNPALLDSLIVQLLRDDGAVVYLNGVELFRNNMPAGAIQAGTLASASVDALEEQTPLLTQFPATGLRAGTNVMAVEVHQSSMASSDMGFDLQLNVAGTTAPRVVIGTPAQNQLLVGPTDVAIQAYASVGTGRTVSRMEFFINGSPLGEDALPPYQMTWPDAPLGTHTILARAVDNFGAAVTSAPVRFVVGYPPVALPFIPRSSAWKYLDNGSNQGTNWSQPSFNDASWASGQAELGYGDSSDGYPEATVVGYGPSATAKYITTYFRRKFVMPPDVTITNLSFRLVRDDGAVVWLNGREMYRSNMPAGTVSFNTPALTSVGDQDERTFHETILSATHLLPGTNVLAVEIHQQAANSSDISFDLELVGNGFTPVALSPELVALHDAGQLQLRWPITATGYQLYSTSELGFGVSWVPVSGGPVTSNGFFLFNLPTTNPAAFYRLQKP